MKSGALILGLGLTMVLAQTNFEPGADGKYTISSTGITAQVCHINVRMKGQWLIKLVLVHPVRCYPHQPIRGGQVGPGRRRCPRLRCIGILWYICIVL